MGRLCKLENPSGYENVLLHMKAHKMAAMEQMMMNAPPPPADSKGGEPAEKGKKPPVEAKPPIRGDENVGTIQ
jgi:hypothetical protein